MVLILNNISHFIPYIDSNTEIIRSKKLTLLAVITAIPSVSLIILKSSI